MALQLPQLPNFQTNIPQANPLQTYTQMLQLRALQGQQAFEQQSRPLQLQQQQQQVQAQQLQIQKQQQELASQKALQTAITGGLFNKYAGVDTPDGSGFDANGAYQDLVKQGVLPQQAGEQVNSLLTIAKNNADIQKTLAQGGEARANIRAKTLDQLAAKLGSINDMSIATAGPALDAFKQDLVKNAAAYPGLTQQELAHLYAADLGHLPAVESLLGVEAKIADFHKSKADATKAEQGIIPVGGGLSPEKQQEVSAYNAETPGAIQRVKAEATVREQIQASMMPLLEQIRQQFGNQKDARDKIETSVLKPYQDKMTDVQMARTAIAQADSNPVSARAAIFKMVGVAQPTGSHRVLPMEFEAFKYPGGVSDQVKEKFNDFLKGEPWTPEVAQAASAFIDGQAGAAQRSLNSGVDNVNSLYGTSVGQGLKQAAPAQSAQPQPIPPSGTTGKARGSDGNWYYHDAKGNILGQAQR